MYRKDCDCPYCKLQREMARREEIIEGLKSDFEGWSTPMETQALKADITYLKARIEKLKWVCGEIVLAFIVLSILNWVM